MTTQLTTHAHRKHLLILATILVLGAVGASAADIRKNNNANNLSGTGAWVGSVVPTLNDVAIWDSGILTAANCTNGPGADLSFGGIRVSNTPAPCKINQGNPVKNVTLGAYGVTLTNTQDIFLEGTVVATNTMTFNIASGRTFRYGNTFDLAGGATFTFNTSGTIEGSGSADSVMRVGGAGAGNSTFNQGGGTLKCSKTGSAVVAFSVGRFAGSPGVYNLTAGSLIANLVSGNIIRIGDEAGSSGTVNASGGTIITATVDVGNNGSGTVNVSGTASVTVTNNMNIPRQTAPATGLVNLDGGTLTIGRAAPNATVPGSGTFNFNGGWLKPTSSRTDFMYSLVSANVKEGGAKIDTVGFSITIAQALLHGGSSAVDGGLTKAGLGTLTLSGAGTYNGPTAVSQGKVSISTAHVGGGSVQVSDAASFGGAVSAPGATLCLASLTLGSSLGATNDYDLGVFGNTTAPVIYATNLTTAGSVVVNVAGIGLTPGQFPLLKYSGSIGGAGFAAFTLVGLPTDVAATLVDNSANKTVDLNVTAAPRLVWTGAANADWDLASFNWTNAIGAASAYIDGYPVVFDDTSSVGNVNLATTPAPARLTVSNNVQAYTFSGAGQIIGAGQLVKQGSGTATLSAPSAYTGDTIVSAGSLALGASDVVPDGTGKGNVQVEGTLDLSGFNETVNGLSGGGTLDNTGVGASVLTVGSGNASGSFTGTVQNTAGSLRLIKIGSGGITLSGNNTYSGGTSNSAGLLQIGGDTVLGSGTLEITSGTVSSSSSAARTIPNDVIVYGGHTQGSIDAPGVLTFTGGINLLNATRDITLRSDVIWTGSSLDGGINKLAKGTLTLKGTLVWSKESEVRDGTLVLDGATVNSSQTVRPDCSVNLSTARLVITNGASATFSAPDGNLRAGFDALNQATNIVDVAGMVRFTAALATNNSRMVLGAGCALGVINLWPGGDVEVWTVLPADSTYAGASELNLRGGILRTRTSNAAYMQGLTRAHIWEGATFDSAGYDITIAQALLGMGSGGVTKIGAGSVKLTGAGTYTNTSLVQEGKLIMTAAHLGGGAIAVQDGATFAVEVATVGSTLRSSSVTLGSSLGATNDFYLGAGGNPTAPVLYATNLVTQGEVTINIAGYNCVAGPAFTLIRYNGSIGGGGFAAFKLGKLPQGVTATLLNNPQSVDLQITAVNPLVWNGNLSSDWDINTTANWRDGVNPAVYEEFVIPGTGVLFNDTAANGNVNVSTTLSPATLVVSNQSLSYTMTGAGQISGTTSFIKQGAGTLALTISGQNSYAGDTRIEAGTVQLGFPNVIPEGAGKGNLVVNGTLDLGAQSDAVNGLSGSGVINNTVGGVSTLAIGSNDVSSVFSGTISGGTAVAITKGGTGTLTLSGNNSYSGGTTVAAGKISLGHNNALGEGLVSMIGGALASDSTTARTITNSMLFTIATTLGDGVNTGKLTFTGPTDLSGAARNITVPADVEWSGFTSDGRINKLGPGTLTISGPMSWNGEAEVREGTLILSGQYMTNTGALRPDCGTGIYYARMVISSGTYLVLDNLTANLRAGYDGQTGATNQLDVAGTVRMPSSDSGNGNLQAGRSSSYGIINLLPGADVEARTVGLGPSASGGEMHFNGAIIRATSDQASFMQGITLTTIRTNGLTIDSAGWTIGISQSLLNGGGSGGLTKVGTGWLNLNGSHTYPGLTLVSQGTLGGNGVVAGALTVAAGAVLAPGAPYGNFTAGGTASLQGTTVISVSKSGATLINSKLVAPTINCTGELIVNNLGPDALTAGDSFDLFDATSFTGAGFAPITLPVVAGCTWDTSQLMLDGTITLTASSSTSPQFTGCVLSGSSLNLSGTGGTPSGTYYVIASTNPAAALASWTPVATNTFDGSGNFSFSMSVTAGPRSFFALQVP